MYTVGTLKGTYATNPRTRSTYKVGFGNLSRTNVAGNNQGSLQDVMTMRSFINLSTVHKLIFSSLTVGCSMVIDCFLLCTLYFTLVKFYVAMSLYDINKIYFDVILHLSKIHHVIHIVYT